MTDLNLDAIRDTLVSVAFEAGQMILAANPSNVSTGTKMNCIHRPPPLPFVTKLSTEKKAADIVTETDQAVERHVTIRLKQAYPSFLFVGEETYIPGTTKITSTPTFIVDPIDGTTNFVHGFPHACISLGFVADKIPRVGVVYNPFLDELYTGIYGKGSYLQRGASLSPSSPKLRLPLNGIPSENGNKVGRELGNLSTALVAVEWGSQRSGPNFALKTRVFSKLAATKEDGGSMVHSLRSLGSAALNLCAVAAGQVDLYWEGGCYAWDVAAGWCILAEAGGRVVSGNPGDWNPEIDSRVYLAVRGAREGQEGIVKEFWGVIGEGERMEYQH
jgi:myo-inositol-1(or 4)-monophosphatase